MLPNQSIAERSADTGVLISFFSKVEKGSTVSYDKINELIKRDIRLNRGIMTTVRNRLLRDYQLVLSCSYNTGYRVLTDAEIVNGELGNDRSRRRKSAIRSKRKAQTVDFDVLSPTERLKCLAEATSANLIAEASKDKLVIRIESNLNGATSPLSLSKALASIKRNVTKREPSAVT